MKNLSLFISAAAILSASSAFAAIDCGTLPTCASLGYTDTIANCQGDVIKCPFDTNTGKCMKGPSIGDLKYSLNSANHDGWILCNGQELNKTTYSALYGVIGTNYGGSGNNFKVPDYRGFFLRAAGTASNLSSYGGSANSDVKTPQKEQLPNITGEWSALGPESQYCSGSGALSAFASSYDHGSGHSSSKASAGIKFNASQTTGTGNNVYKDYGHVIPANYAAYVFIYSGVKVTDSSYRCNICGYLHEGATTPTKCPYCGSSSFTRQ